MTSTEQIQSVVVGDSSLELSREQEIGLGEEILADHRSQSLDELRELGFSIDPDGSEQASSQEINDLAFVDMHSIQRIAKTDMAQARQALAALMDPESNDFAHYMNQMGTGAVPFKYHAYQVVADTKNFYQNNLFAYDNSILVPSNGRAMRITINYYSADPNPSGAGELREVVYQRVGMILPGGDESEKWVTTEILATEEPNFINDLRPIDATFE